MRLPVLLRLPLAFAGAFLFTLRADETPTYRTPSAPLAAIVDAPTAPTASISPDRSQLLLLERPDAPPIAELAQPELRIAGLRIDPLTNGPSRLSYFTGMTIRAFASGAERRVTGLPQGVRIGEYEWARDGRHLALSVVTDKGIQLWVVDVSTAAARRLTDPILNATLGSPFAWLDEATLVIRRVPAQRGAPPVDVTVPTGPIIQENLGRRAASRTFEDLLASPHDEALFEYYGISELALVSLEGKLTPTAARGLISSVSPSPDGQHLLVHTIHRPYSYLVPASRFPVAIAVYDRTGKSEFAVIDQPLNEATAVEVTRPGPRLTTWRADAPATLSWFAILKAPTAKKGEKQPPRPDGWFTLAAPFTAKPELLQQFGYRGSSVQWGDDSFALVTEYQLTTKKYRIWRVAPGQPRSPKTLLFDRNNEDRYGDPGRVATARNAWGRLVIQRSPDKTKFYLYGAGASPEGDRPFLDEYDPETKTARRLWRSAPPNYEEFVAFIDAAATKAMTIRESATTPTNYFIRNFATGELTALTNLPNPYPQFAGVKQELVRYQRADGVALSGTLYLPPGWTPEKGPLPTLVWAYPHEFQSAETAAQVKATPERFSRVSATGPLPFLLAGYAVLNDPAMPIIAKDGKKPNDTYLEQLVANAQAAVDELVRRGVADPKRIAVGGHSYGAFMTANLLAHSRLFRAGIARSGAYNRTLTPFGFQNERRNFWEAPNVYAEMSPFNYANKVKDALLLIHGAADNNSGTFPIQSERFYNALKGHGATTRFVLLPHEAHGYRARENLLHMLWEMETWLDTYVKNPKADAAEKPEAKAATQ